MAPKGFKLIRKLVLATAALPPNERQAFLEKICAGDLSLMREVESLLNHENEKSLMNLFGGSFLAVSTFEAQSDKISNSEGPKDSPGPLTGRTICHFLIENQIGRGGMGDVYKAVDTKLQRSVVLKFLSKLHRRDALVEERFSNEAKAISSLDHPNIGGIFEYVPVCDGLRFTVMPFYEGGSVKDLVASGPQTWQDTLKLALQVASGLSAAHQAGILHRDLKPRNIMLTENGVVKIIDFGMEKLLDRIGTTQPGAALGTIAYMSPEHIQDNRIDVRSDVFSFGVTTYELLTGHLPLDGESTAAQLIKTIRPEPFCLDDIPAGVPDGLEAILQRAMAKNPDDRYQSLVEMRHDLLQVRDQGELKNSSADNPKPKVPARIWQRVRAMGSS